MKKLSANHRVLLEWFAAGALWYLAVGLLYGEYGNEMKNKATTFYGQF